MVIWIIISVLFFISWLPICDSIGEVVFGILTSFILGFLVTAILWGVLTCLPKERHQKPDEVINLSMISDPSYTIVTNGYIYYIPEGKTDFSKAQLEQSHLHIDPTAVPHIDRYYYRSKIPLVTFLFGYLDSEYEVYIPNFAGVEP